MLLDIWAMVIFICLLVAVLMKLETRFAVEEIVYKPLQKIGGSITGEHGIGLEKKPWLYLSKSVS